MGKLRVTRLRSGDLKRIHVDQHVLRENRTTGARDPVVIVKAGTSCVFNAHEVLIRGASRVVYSPDKPLSCGATLWVETRSEIDLVQT